MDTATTDYRTHPGNRNTALTATQRAAKLAKAERLAAEARALLREVCDDFTANAYRLSNDETTEWSAVARASDSIHLGKVALTDHISRADLARRVAAESATA